MSQENVEIVRRVIDARNRCDRDAAFAYAAPDIEFDYANSAGPWAGVYRGVEATRRLWDGMDEVSASSNGSRKSSSTQVTRWLWGGDRLPRSRGVLVQGRHSRPVPANVRVAPTPSEVVGLRE
jgi:hypothetical protein